MAVAQAYGKTVTSGSVFAYDTGDTRNSFRGRPTVNYIAHHNAMPQTSYDTYTYTTSGTWPAKHPLAIRAYNAQGTEISAYVNTGVGDWTNTYHAHWQYDPILKKPVTVMQASDSNWKAKSFGTGMAAWASLGMSAGQQYVISWDQYTTDINLCADAGFYSRNGSGTTGFHDGRSYSSAKNTLLNTWQRVYYTFTVNATRNLNDSYGSIYMYGYTTSNSGGTLKIANVQLELGVSVPSPYVEHTSAGLSSTRSSTQGLLPLVGNSTVDLTNVSFNSNAQIVFDGTDDLIDITTNFGTLSAYTFEYVAYANSGGNMPIASRTNTNFYKYGAYSWRYTHGGVGGEFYHNYGNDTGWSHWVITYDGSTISVWENGISKGTASSSGTADFSGGIRIGSWASSAAYTWDGTIPVFRMYNRALSAAEVKQNFDFYDARFGIEIEATYYYVVSNRAARYKRFTGTGKNMATSTPAYIIYQKPDASNTGPSNYTEVARDDIGTPTRTTIYGNQLSYSNGRYLTDVTVYKSRRGGKLSFEFPNGGTSQYGENFYKTIVAPHVP